MVRRWAPMGPAQRVGFVPGLAYYLVAPAVLPDGADWDAWGREQVG
jgi:hypothetical protein